MLRFDDAGTSRTHELASHGHQVGRLPGCDVLLSDMSVSRKHAAVWVERGRCFVQDVGSRFGTFLNDRQLLATDTPASAGPGDILRFGHVVVQIEQRIDERDLLSEDHAIVEGPGTVYKSLSGALSTTALADGQLVRLIADVGRTVISSQSLNDILLRVVGMAFDAVPADRAFLLLRESEDAALEARLLLHRDGTVPTAPTLSRAIVRKVLRERVAILAADATLDADLSVTDSVARFQIRSFICAPLWSRSDVIGVLYLDSPVRGRFTAEHLDAITALANAAAIAIEQGRLACLLLEEQTRRERLQRYHSPAVVSRIIHQQGDVDHLQAQVRDVTVMFCDLVGFTARCESLTPVDAASLLNTFLTRMTDVVFEHEGMLDKYLGDALLAVFGAPFDQPDHALRAVQAAIVMRQTLADMNARRPDADRLQMRIAINTGPALTGDIGSPRRREFTVLGDVVNTASRIESEVAGPNEIVISESTFAHVKDRVSVRPLPPRQLRGRTAATGFYAVVAN
jgi:adenylate cyclase